MNRRSFLSRAVCVTSAAVVAPTLLASLATDVRAESQTTKPKPVVIKRRVKKRRVRRTRTVRTRRVYSRRPVAIAVPTTTLVVAAPLVERRLNCRRGVWRQWRGRRVLVVPVMIDEGWELYYDSQFVTVRELRSLRVDSRLREMAVVETQEGEYYRLEVLRENISENRDDLEVIYDANTPGESVEYFE